jgi:hypothetical protein
MRISDELTFVQGKMQSVDDRHIIRMGDIGIVSEMLQTRDRYFSELLLKLPFKTIPLGFIVLQSSAG